MDLLNLFMQGGTLTEPKDRDVEEVLEMKKVIAIMCSAFNVAVSNSREGALKEREKTMSELLTEGHELMQERIHMCDEVFALERDNYFVKMDDLQSKISKFSAELERVGNVSKRDKEAYERSAAEKFDPTIKEKSEKNAAEVRKLVRQLEEEQNKPRNPKSQKKIADIWVRIQNLASTHDSVISELLESISRDELNQGSGDEPWKTQGIKSLPALKVVRVESLKQDDFQLKENGYTIRFRGKDAATGKTTPLHKVTVDKTTRVIYEIPPEADQFCFVYPGIESQSLRSSGGMDLRLVDLARLGGYAYFDKSKRFIQANAFQDHEGLRLICFSGPYQLPEEANKSLQSAGRFVEVTAPHLRKVGAIEFAWINPSEDFGGLVKKEVAKQWAHGCFAYRYSDESRNNLFSVANMSEISLSSSPRIDRDEKRDTSLTVLSFAKLDDSVSLKVDHETPEEGALRKRAVSRDSLNRIFVKMFVNLFLIALIILTGVSTISDDDKWDALRIAFLPDTSLDSLTTLKIAAFVLATLLSIPELFALGVELEVHLEVWVEAKPRHKHAEFFGKPLAETFAFLVLFPFLFFYKLVLACSAGQSATHLMVSLGLWIEVILTFSLFFLNFAVIAFSDNEVDVVINLAAVQFIPTLDDSIVARLFDKESQKKEVIDTYYSD